MSFAGKTVVITGAGAGIGRELAQQLARGDLSARVGEGLVHKTDEVADLARDVDRMAERIEGLVNSHQRLIRDVSHELRSPLARLNVALELARKSAGPGHAAPFDRIERESERLNELMTFYFQPETAPEQ